MTSVARKWLVLGSLLLVVVAMSTSPAWTFHPDAPFPAEEKWPSRHVSAASSPEPKASPVRSRLLTSPVTAGAGAPIVREEVALVELTREQRLLVHAAEQHAIAACMRARGQSYEPELDEEPHEATFDAFTQNDPDAAHSLGYGLAEQFGAEQSDVSGQTEGRDPERSPQPAVSAPSGNALGPRADAPNVDSDMTIVRSADGSLEKRWDPRSCRSIGWREVHGDTRTAIALESDAEVLLSDIERTARQDDGVTRSLERWKDCARALKFPYQQPGEAIEALRSAYVAGELDLEDLREREIAAASIEADCAAEAGLAQAFSEAKQSVARELLDGRTEVVHAALAHNTNLIETAQRWAAD